MKEWLGRHKCCFCVLFILLLILQSYSSCMRNAKYEVEREKWKVEKDGIERTIDSLNHKIWEKDIQINRMDVIISGLQEEITNKQ